MSPTYYNTTDTVLASVAGFDRAYVAVVTNEVQHYVDNGWLLKVDPVDPDAPTLTSCEPNPVTVGGSGELIDVTLNGTNFQDGATVSGNLDGGQYPFEDVAAENVTDTSLTVTQQVNIEMPGTWQFTVDNPDGTTTGPTNGLLVVAEPVEQASGGPETYATQSQPNSPGDDGSGASQEGA